MKYALPIFFLVFLLGCNGNEKSSRNKNSSPKINSNSVECNNAILEAQADIKAGKICYRWVGIADPPFLDTLKQKYKIEVIKEGCEAKGGEHCYDSIMRDAIIARFGKDIIQIEEAKDNMNLVLPKFPGGEMELSKFLNEHLNYSKENNRFDSGKVILSFNIDTNGRVSMIIIKKGLTPIIDSACISAVKEMPKWLPGSYFGKKMDMHMSLPIDFKGN